MTPVVTKLKIQILGGVLPKTVAATEVAGDDGVA
jgi:hypothetical protein